ncbi:hypothetical protein COT82_02395 [Candidatus Campbellbacteria bacterium CG10_big_fil_rev_8_21_14_0_10_35_52]|uniref:Glycosyl transferase family 1 domain-containing protein n=1 Tax=Candidatus Campbellbacteria bacterium CG10_big_fil_rev_8_21_14_0_10_35_52 TaxID=1974527 RepID=A0A2M6WUX7_9BACT|nr:MAG: hypothetical protein COT82_02395 [Candidatus Campbellbacteria bacterium CG10_big_fil_rev_8_21_14_0_10_35_52]
MKEKVFDKLDANQNKNILIATGLFPPDIGGPATYSKLLLDELPKHNFNVSVLSFGEVRKLPKILRHIFYFFKVLRGGGKADIIFAQDPVSVGLPSMLAAKILRKKFLLKIVGDYAWEQYQNKLQITNYKLQTNLKFKTLEKFQIERSDFITELRRKIERSVAKRASKIIVPSNYLKKIILMWGINEEKISVIYNGLKYNQESGNRETIRALLQFEGKLIISAGRLVQWKGFDTLIKIFPYIKKKFNNAKLIIAGSGPDLGKLQKLIDDKELSNDIALTGALPKEVLLRYIKASDVFVLNTGYEGFSHQLLEVMDVGIPLITTNIGGNPEIIKNGENGLLVGYNDEKELGKSIIKLLSDKKYADKLVLEAKKKVKEFSEERMIKETIKLLKTI